jgi:hypothetical protein
MKSSTDEKEQGDGPDQVGNAKSTEEILGELTQLMDHKISPSLSPRKVVSDTGSFGDIGRGDIGHGDITPSRHPSKFPPEPKIPPPEVQLQQQNDSAGILGIFLSASQSIVPNCCSCTR